MKKIALILLSLFILTACSGKEKEKEEREKKEAKEAMVKVKKELTTLEKKHEELEKKYENVQEENTLLKLDKEELVRQTEAARKERNLLIEQKKQEKLKLEQAQKVRKEKEQNAHVTYEEYLRIKPKMTYEEVVEIIGSEGILESELDYNENKFYKFNGKIQGTYMNITFYLNKVFSKSQVGLK